MGLMIQKKQIKNSSDKRTNHEMIYRVRMVVYLYYFETVV